MRVQPTPPSSQPLPEVRVATDADGVVGHAGLRLLTDLADRLGLTRELGRHANAGVRRGALDRGRVLRDLAVTLAGGGTAVSDLAVLRTQPGLFGHVASTSTAWRVLGEVGGDPAKLAGVWLALARARRRVWAHGGAPPGDGPLLVDLDGVLVDAHTPKQGAAATFKRGFGFHPLGAWLDRGDGTGEALAVVLREGRAGSNTAADHVGLLAMALAALPAGQRRTRGVLVRCDAAGATHGLLDACRAWGARFSVGFDVTAKVRQAIAAVPCDGWVPALDSHGRPRSDAHVAELASLELPGWPPGSRVLCRREPATAGARASGKPVDQAGRRLQAVLTDQPDTDVAVVERRHRQHASVEIVCTQVTKLRRGAGVGGGDHVADLDLAVGHHHPVDQQFHQLAALLEAGLVKAHP